jgi:dTDP-D-glucose 4,6-dehydratase
MVELPQRWPNEPNIWQADMSKTLKTVNWAPKYDLNAGLTKSVDWFEKHQHLYH